MSKIGAIRPRGRGGRVVDVHIHIDRGGDGSRLLRSRRKRRSSGLSRFVKFRADFVGELGGGASSMRSAHVHYALQWREKLVDPGVFDLLLVERKIVWRSGAT